MLCSGGQRWSERFNMLQQCDRHLPPGTARSSCDISRPATIVRLASNCSIYKLWSELFWAGLWNLRLPRNLCAQGKQSIEDGVVEWNGRPRTCCRSRSWTICWRSWRSQTSPSSRLRRHSTGVSPSLTSSKLAVSFACSSRTIFWHRHSAWLDSTFSTTSTGRNWGNYAFRSFGAGDGGDNKWHGWKEVPAAVPVVLTQGTAKAKCAGLSPKLWSGRGSCHPRHGRSTADASGECSGGEFSSSFGPQTSDKWQVRWRLLGPVGSFKRRFWWS